MTEAAIVTGAAGALGRAMARRLGRDGLALVMVDRDPRVQDAADGLLDDGIDAAACVADLDVPEPAHPILQTLERRRWTARVLVNNAGVNRDARATKMSDEDFATVIRVDLVAPARLAQALRPRIVDGGAVVNIASRAALGNFGQANYAAAKAGLMGLTRALAVQWAPHVRVNAVAPGLIDTPMTAGMPKTLLERLVARVPAGRMGASYEVAEVVAFLASPAASYVTGQVLLACGGRSIAP